VIDHSLSLCLSLSISLSVSLSLSCRQIDGKVHEKILSSIELSSERSTTIQEVSHRNTTSRTAENLSARLIGPDESRLDDFLIDPIADWSFSHRSSLYRGGRGTTLLPRLSRPTLNEPMEKTSELVQRPTTERYTENPGHDGTSFASLSLCGTLIEKKSNIDPVTGRSVVQPAFLRVQQSINDFFDSVNYPEKTFLLVRSVILSAPSSSISLSVCLCLVRTIGHYFPNYFILFSQPNGMKYLFFVSATVLIQSTLLFFFWIYQVCQSSYRLILLPPRSFFTYSFSILESSDDHLSISV
jgi:hypothetical protein